MDPYSEPMASVDFERFRIALNASGRDQSSLARAVGVTPGTIHQIVTGKIQRSRYLPDIAEALGVTLAWLRGENEDGGPGSLPVPPVVEPIDGFDDYVMVDTLPTYAGAGGGGTGDGDLQKTLFPRALVERELRAAPEDILAVVILGDSMEPDFRNGDQLLVDKRLRSINQPGAFCLWDGDGYVIKLLEKVYDTDPPKVRVISRNQIYKAAERLADEVRIMGRVVWFGRRV